MEDVDQTDLDYRSDGGLDVCMDRLHDVEGVSICELDSSDIVRNKIISKILCKL